MAYVADENLIKRVPSPMHFCRAHTLPSAIFSRKTQRDASNSARERFLMLLRDTLLDFHDRLCRARKTNGC